MLEVHRTGVYVRPDSSRVLFRPLGIGPEERASRVVSRLLYLPETEATRLAQRIALEFDGRHDRLRAYLLRRFEQVEPHLPTDRTLSDSRKILIGAAFTQEYALEAAALFNPSIVPHPDQSELPEGALRFVLSLRAVGEGHISSIVFRDGIVSTDGTIEILPPAEYSTAGDSNPDPYYDKELFLRKLGELGLLSRRVDSVMARLDDSFTLTELEGQVARELRRDRSVTAEERHLLEGVRALAQANYELQFQATRRLSECVIYPNSPAERYGIEDARFVAFTEEEGSVTYYAPYTAFSGELILPQMLETDDFQRFRITTLNGPMVENKGLALFPRRINGHYAMLARQDNENIYLMYSDMLHFWYTRRRILRPTFWWEAVQIGNCGSPIETEAGWLLITHGVGPMRKYSLGAVLLEKNDPAVVLGRLPQPLMTPIEHEREGYVPNVLYSCGALVHAGRLVLPYAMSDQSSSFALIALDELLEELLRWGPTGRKHQGEGGYHTT